MILKIVLIINLFISMLFSVGQEKSEAKIINLSKGEKVWAGIINDGSLMPFSNEYKMDFYANNKYNQLQPLILTNKGQYVWSEKPFKFSIKATEIVIQDPYNQVVCGRQGDCLAEVQGFVRNKYFPATGALPDTLLFTNPQYNTWIELTYHQNQKEILEYAEKVVNNGLPPGVIMIDDTWQEDYGLWKFHPGRFPDPKKMIAKLHKMGFKVMLWICPFVSADQALLYKRLKNEKAFLLERESSEDTWESQSKPLMVEWWNGQSALLDFSNPVAVDWFNGQLDHLVNEYGVDGFKFDAGDMDFYPQNSISKLNISPNQHCELYAKFGLRFPLNEYRACWKMGGQPLAQRLLDKEHSWADLNKLIPNMIIEGLCGYTFSCPDMIGGGLWSSFSDESTIDQDLIVRSAQCHALMPMMQFSVAPWRILDNEHMEAVKKAVSLRMKFVPIILQLAKKAAKDGTPILRSLDFEFPNRGFESITDEFMLGSQVLVAPMLEKGFTRIVTLPEGTWRACDGKIFTGGKSYEFNVLIDQLLYFELED